MFKYIKHFWKDNLLVGFILFGGAISQTFGSVLTASAFNALIAFDLQEFVVITLQMFIVYMFFLLFTYLQIVKQNQAIQKWLLPSEKILRLEWNKQVIMVFMKSK